MLVLVHPDVATQFRALASCVVLSQERNQTLDKHTNLSGALPVHTDTALNKGLPQKVYV